MQIVFGAASRKGAGSARCWAVVHGAGPAAFRHAGGREPLRAEFLPFSRPSITEEDMAAVADVLRSGWITTGPKAAAFETAFAEYVGCGGAVALSSATAGMHLLLRAFNVGPGDEVITPSMTWVSTVNLI